jgi:hypothetical protein
MSEVKLKPVTRTIGGHAVEVTPFAARYALSYKFKLFQLLGGPLVDVIRGPVAGLLKNVEVIKAILSGATLDSMVGKYNLDVNLDGLSARMFDTLDPDRSTQLIFEMCACTRYDNHEMTETFINGEFAGSLSVLYQVFFFVLEVNYKDFLEALGTTRTAAPTVTTTKK